MPRSDELSAYIAERLKAGVSSEQIAYELSARGMRSSEVLPETKSITKTPLLQKLARYAVPISLFVVGVSIPAAFQLIGSTQPSRISAGVAPIGPADFSAERIAALTDGNPAILGVATDSASASESAEPIELEKEEYKIAFIGDSMIDTFDDQLELLKEKLEEKYEAEFTLYNYGIGSENVEDGLNRFEHQMVYKERSYPPLSQLEADIIVIGSFAYNPFELHDVNRYWLTMAQLVEKAQATEAAVYLLADIAPLYEKFAVGTMDWNTAEREDHAEKIAQQLDSVVALAGSLEVPLIDLYTETQKEDRYGDGEFTSSDGIHPNEKGKELLIEKLLESLEFSVASESATPSAEEKE